MPALWLERAKHIHHSLLLSYCRDKVVETTWELHTPIVINSWHHLTLRRACIDSEPVMLKTYCGSGQQPERHIPLGSHHSQSNIFLLLWEGRHAPGMDCSWMGAIQNSCFWMSHACSLNTVPWWKWNATPGFLLHSLKTTVPACVHNNVDYSIAEEKKP